MRMIAWILMSFVFWSMSPVFATPDKGAVVEFSLEKQGRRASEPQILKISVGSYLAQAGACAYKLTLNVYDKVVTTSSLNDFIVGTPLAGDCEALSRGVEISFRKDGEYHIFAEATWSSGVGASNSYCFIVRNGLLYGAPFFDDAEGEIILDEARRGGYSWMKPLLQQKYKARMKERERLKRQSRGEQ